ncbi:MAG: FAD-dependent oxidoreductase [Clostridia bacterium]
MDKKTEFYDVVVIGGGPGGMTAALYAGRARLKTLLIEKSLIGGMATYTSEIENYPGFPLPIGGIELTEQMNKQFRRFGVDVKLTDVRSVTVDCDTKIVSTFRTDYIAKAVVIATGNKPRLTGAKGEEQFRNDKGISFCATCDAARNEGKRILVVGSGDAAIEEGMFLTKFAKEVVVSVIHNEGIMDANKVAQEKAIANPKMSFIWNTVVDSFEGDDMLRTVNLKNIKNGEIIPVDVDACFLFIGYIPNTKVFSGLVDMTERGYIKTNEDMETSVHGIFAAGDCREKTLRQVATAVGDGAIAGFMAEKYVEEIEYVKNEILGAKELILAYIYNAVEAVDREFLERIEKITNEYKGKVLLRRIDVYKSDRIACRLSYEKTPSIVFLKKGEAVENITDLSAVEKTIRETIEKHLSTPE